MYETPFESICESPFAAIVEHEDIELDAEAVETAAEADDAETDDDATLEATEDVGAVTETGASDEADDEEAATDDERPLFVVVVAWPLTDGAGVDDDDDEEEEEEEEGEEEEGVADVKMLDEVTVMAEP